MHAYIDKATALKVGMTHEGTIFGAPMWFEGDPLATGMITGIPKSSIFTPWIWLCDQAFELATWFMLVEQSIQMPCTCTGRIKL